jgi:transcriptional regulator with XRE-family HTH domain
MSYGLDLSDCRFITDHQGNRLRAEIPYTMFSMLVEFRNAALRAQTERTENRTRPGDYRASLVVGPSAQPDTASEPPRPDQPFTAQQHPPQVPKGKPHSVARQQAEAMFAPAAPVSAPINEPASDAAVEVTGEPSKSTGKHRVQVFFPRVFRVPIPDEVARLIDEGIYFLRAWRLYRQYSVSDAAELLKLSGSAIACHERGYNVPDERTLQKFADIYDCTLEQLTVKKKTNTRPPHEIKAEPVKSSAAPIDTQYPDAVMGYMLDGKAPLTAWRLYRRMSLHQVAESYGSTVSNIEQLEKRESLREKTREKLASVLGCKPVQLLRPDGFEPSNAGPLRNPAREVGAQAVAA